MKRIGFIGTGHIAAPMVRFLAAKGHAIYVSERNNDTAQRLEQSHGVTIAANQYVVDQTDIVFLCLRPAVAQGIIKELRFRGDQQIISVMAGLSLQDLERLCAPASDISMTIPLGYLEQGGCPLPACPHASVLASLFEPENPVIEVADEAAFTMHFAVCALVPGVLDLLATASDWLGAKTGDPATAEQYTRQLVSGFLASLPAGQDQVLANERDALATPNTLSHTMTETLHQGGAHQALLEALDRIAKGFDTPK